MGPRICWWSLGGWVQSPWSHWRGGCWLAWRLCPKFLSSLLRTKWTSWSLPYSILTFVLEQVFVLLYQFLASQPTIFVEKVDFQNLLLVLTVSWTEQGCHNEWEEVSECSVSHILSENVVVVRVKELMSSKFIPRVIRYRKHTGNIFVYRWQGRASYHPIRLGYYKGVQSEESRVMAFTGISGAIFLATWRRSTIFLTDWSLWILVYLDRGKFWSLSPMRWVNVK